MFPSVDLRTGQTGNLFGSACDLWLLGSPDIRNYFHTPKKEIGDVTINALDLVDVLSSKVVSSSLKKNVGSIKESQYYIFLHFPFTKLITSTCSKYTSPNTNCRSNPTSHPVPEHFPSSALAKPSGLIDGRTDISVAGGHRQIRST